jgi:hypothetical protein
MLETPSTPGEDKEKTMTRVRTVIVGTDGSETANRAVAR